MIIDIESEGEGEDDYWRRDYIREACGEYRDVPDGADEIDDEDDEMDEDRIDADEFLPESSRAGFELRETLVDEVLKKHFPHMLHRN